MHRMFPLVLIYFHNLGILSLLRKAAKRLILLKARKIGSVCQSVTDPLSGYTFKIVVFGVLSISFQCEFFFY